MSEQKEGRKKGWKEGRKIGKKRKESEAGRNIKYNIELVVMFNYFVILPKKLHKNTK
jgi:hypothetical protein